MNKRMPKGILFGLGLMGEKREIPVDFLRPLLTEGACVLDSGRMRAQRLERGLLPFPSF